jgi:hypothetical protein
MPTVSYRADTFTFDNPSPSIEAMYNGLAQLLPENGCTNVTNEGDHVHCDSGGVSLSVTFLSISGNTYWRVVMAAEDSNPANADAQIATVVDVTDALIGV